MTCLARIFSLGIIVASLGCGKESLPQKPQLVVDRESLGFGQEFGSGVYIGTMKTDSIQTLLEKLNGLIASYQRAEKNVTDYSSSASETALIKNLLANAEYSRWH